MILKLSFQVRAQYHHHMNQNLTFNAFMPMDDITLYMIVIESNIKTKTMKCFPSSAFTQSLTLWWRHLHTFTGEIAKSPFCKTPPHITTAHSPSLWNAKLKQTTIHLFEMEFIRQLDSTSNHNASGEQKSPWL